MSSDRLTLTVAPREHYGSRAGRRLRRQGIVPGVVYGSGEAARSFQVAERDLRAVLAHGGTLIDLEIEGSKAVPAVVKDQQRHPVRGDLVHIDLLEVNLKESIQSEVLIELIGAEDAAGVKLGGVLEQITHQAVVESLPTHIPESLSIDITAMEIGDTLSLSAIEVPEGASLVAENPDEIPVVTISPPRVADVETTDVEEETEVVGEAAGDDSSDDSGSDGD